MKTSELIEWKKNNEKIFEIVVECLANPDCRPEDWIEIKNLTKKEKEDSLHMVNVMELY